MFDMREDSNAKEDDESVQTTRKTDGYKKKVNNNSSKIKSLIC